MNVVYTITQWNWNSFNTAVQDSSSNQDHTNMSNIEEGKYSFLMQLEDRELEKQIEVFYFSSLAFPFPVHFNNL